MRADAIAPRTWLLVAVAGWALLVWLLALFGLGGRIAPLPADPSLIANLPQPGAAATSRVGPFGQYAQIATRPAFNPDRRPRPFFIEGQGQGEAAQAFDYVLTGVLITPQLEMAILQPSSGDGLSLRVKVGESPEGNAGWRLAEVHPRSAIFDSPEGQRTLELRTYTGGGEAPTAAAGAAPPLAARDETSDTANAAVAAAKQAELAAQTGKLPPPPAAQPTLTPEQQMQQIRQRIEARRAQLRRQAEQTQGGSRPVQTPSPPER